jgi:RNA-binding protein
MEKSAATAPAALSERQLRHLRGLAHPLKPVVRIGKTGLTEGVELEAERALHDHELIKIRGMGGDREARDATFAALAAKTRSVLVHRIGNVAVFFRARPALSRIVIPDA